MTKKTHDLQNLINSEVEERTEAELLKLVPQIKEDVHKALGKTFDEAVTKRIEETRPTVARKVRADLIRSLLGDDGVTVHVAGEPLTPAMVQAVLDDSMKTLGAARGITKGKHGWCCAFCEMKFNTQRAASIHSKACTKRPDVPAEEKRMCIKPDCGAPSKGPKFHHLCEKHVKASKKNWEVWQKQHREAEKQG